MATKTTFRSKDIEATLDRTLGTRDGKARWRYVEAVSVDDVKARVDSQSRTTPLNRTSVTTIANKMKEGIAFDPIVMWETPDNGIVLIDGGHRTAAAQRAKVPTLPAYIVTADNQGEALYLSAAFNAQNGNPLTPAEVRRVVLNAFTLGYTPERVAQDFGVARNTVASIVAEKASTDRAARLGISIDGLTKSHLRVLNRVTLDGPFADAACLAAEAGMSVSDFTKMVNEVQALPSEDAQAARVREEKSARRDDIARVQTGRKASGTPFTDLRSVIAQVNRARQSYPDPKQWLATDPETVHAWGPQVTEAAEFLSAVASAYTRFGE
jgi:ParB-like chromosome segregation protein Spo0J